MKHRTRAITEEKQKRNHTHLQITDNLTHTQTELDREKE